MNFILFYFLQSDTSLVSWIVFYPPLLHHTVGNFERFPSSCLNESPICAEYYYKTGGPACILFLSIRGSSSFDLRTSW
ncbi:hypothetical protein GOP47_0012240 [Adiantum capillus-veneris]|uniref:Uncharacterized protein n=1 Tax=Adiantum capillus-veneris TaxID=13818 RepID=A0A9D4UQT5_ADICA|nr:hypothetical protein GOP47_0012240 [Adiantum capillus-veneris]